jgi:hypothetical protein
MDFDGCSHAIAELLPSAHPCLSQCCTKDKHDFVSKIFLASGISVTRPALPACLQPTHTEEPKTDLLHAQQEAKLVYGQVIAEVLRKTGDQSKLLRSAACAARGSHGAPHAAF